VPLLKAVSIYKSFAGVSALRGVSFELEPSEVHALVGENGAGKSTLIKIITGALQPDAGHIELDGNTIEHNDPLTAKSLGIACIYQQPALFAELSVAENIAVALERNRAFDRVNWPERRLRARQLLAQLGTGIDPDREAGSLSMPEQQMVEIARALGSNARVLVMDEPTASLSDREVDALFNVIRELRTRGVGIIYISHRLEELSLIADRLTVLRDGQSIETRSMKDLDRPTIVRLMVGRELSAVFPKRKVPICDVVLETRSLTSVQAGIHGVNLTVRAGEILGLAGLVGSGRTEVAKTLFGLTPADQGSILIRGNAVRIDSPARAMELGIAYIPEDRRQHGAILTMSIAENTTLASLDKCAHGGFIDFGAEAISAADWVRRLGVKAHSVFDPVSTLSGGNQQKVVIGRWLATKPAIVILDEPTQGIDVGAKAEVHRLMVDLAEAGVAVLMISSEMPEIFGMSDRIAVMAGGTIAGVLDREEATPQNVMTLALGHGVAA